MKRYLKPFCISLFLWSIPVIVFWSFWVDGTLYYCSDPVPVLDMIPPFVHGKQFGDYFIVRPVLVWSLWVFLLLFWVGMSGWSTYLWKKKRDT